MSETVKPGYKTFGFYIAAVLTVISGVAASGADLGAVGAVLATVLTGATAAGYAAFRAFKKSEDPTKPGWKTTEFWLTVAAAVLSAINFSGAFAETSNVGKIIAVASGLMAMMGYQITKPKK